MTKKDNKQKHETKYINFKMIMKHIKLREGEKPNKLTLAQIRERNHIIKIMKELLKIKSNKKNKIDARNTSQTVGERSNTKGRESQTRKI